VNASRRRPLCILGAGGHAKVVIATARAAGHVDVEVYDDDPARVGTTLLAARVVGPLAAVLDDPDRDAVLAIGDNAARHRLGSLARCHLVTLVHPTAHVHETVTLGAGTVVFAGAVIQPDTRLGTNVIVNTSASIDHDCILGDAVHVAPGTHLAGNVTLGDGVLLGVGTSVIPGRRIGAWTTVGAGAAVTSDLPAHVTAVGVPARAR
jgi:sugar O-acyltransferase (sialic acid O-acetyltransferase NeuD family)